MKTIIAAIDFSTVTPRVVDAAIKLGRLAKGRVVLLHVVPAPATFRNVLPAVEDVDMRTKTATHAAEKKLLEVKRSFRRKFPKLELSYPMGVPAPRIVEQAGATRAAYVVVGSKGRSALREALLGSVASAVAKTAPCPVVIIPAQARAPARSERR